MMVMFKLTYRQMIRQKRRTLITLLGAIVSVAMIAAVSTFGGSFMKLFYNVTAESSGEWHSMFSDITPQAAARIAQDGNVKEIYAINELKTQALPQKQGRYEQLSLCELDDIGFTAQRVAPIEGTLPTNDSECVISEAYAKRSGLSVGSSIAVDGMNCTVVGIASMEPIESSYSNTAFVLTRQSKPITEAYADSTDTIDSVYVLFNNVDNSIFSWTDSLEAELNCKAHIHNSLLAYTGTMRDGPLSKTIYMMSAIIMMIIVVAAISMIYNTFAISVTDRSMQFGMLASIGATPSQRRLSVLLEALLISIIAIPLGLIFGFIGIGVTFNIVGSLIAAVLNGVTAKLSLVVLPEAILLAIGISLATILISAWIPAIRAARISPMEAMRATRDIKLTARKVRTSRLMQKLFGFEGELALKNLKRNSKRYRITILSLVVSLVLYMSACVFTNYMSMAYSMTGNGELDSIDIMAKNYIARSDDADTISKTDMDTYNEFNSLILDTPGIDEISSLTTDANMDVRLSGASYTQAAANIMEHFKVTDIGVSIVAPDANTLQNYAALLGVDYAALTDAANPQAIIVNHYNVRTGSSYVEADMLNISAGDPISIVVGTLAANSQPDKQYSMRAVAVTAKRPLGINVQSSAAEIYVVVSHEVLASMYTDIALNTKFFIKCSDSEAVSEVIYAASEALTADNIQFSLTDMASNTKQMERTTLVINIFVFGFITLLTLVSVINIAGTISTSLTLRSREFAMLRSVGMTRRSFARMIRYESIFYGIKTLMYGLPLSLLMAYAMHSALGVSFEMAFTIPWVQMLWGILGVFVVVFMTMAYSSARIRRMNVIEALRMSV